MLNSARKLSRHAFSLWNKLKSVTASAAARFPAQTRLASGLGAPVTSIQALRALIGGPLSYGDGGVVKEVRL